MTAARYLAASIPSIVGLWIWVALLAAPASYVGFRYALPLLLLGLPRVALEAVDKVAPAAAIMLLLALVGSTLMGRRKRRSNRPEGRRQEGQTLVEFALIAPVLLLLSLGCADLGRVFYVAAALSNATGQAARAASTYTTNAQVLRAAYCEQPYFAWNFIPPAGNACDASNWASWSGSYTALPASPSSNTAYIAIAEDTSFPSDVPAGTPSWTNASRQGGHLPVQAQVDYYWTPLTPFISNLLPNGVVHLHFTSQEREQY